jgi:hypothetical protein
VALFVVGVNYKVFLVILLYNDTFVDDPISNRYPVNVNVPAADTAVDEIFYKRGLSASEM